MNKDVVAETLNDLPQDFELDVLFERLVFIEKVQKGLDQLDQGKTIKHADIKQKIKKWK